MSRAVLFVALLVGVAYADFRNHVYKNSDELPVYANTVGPYKNPTETYGYYDRLPVCRPPTIKHRIESLGEVLEGNRLITSGYDVHFLQNMDKLTICTQLMTPQHVEEYKDAIDQSYFFHMLLDDLPIWGFVGRLVGDRYYLLTHLHFLIEYNGDRIVHANLTNVDDESMYTELEAAVGTHVQYKYSVTWRENKGILFEDRMDLYRFSHFFPKANEIHWILILNSLFLVALLTFFLFLILLRVLRNDFSRYSSSSSHAEAGTSSTSSSSSSSSSSSADDADDFGWKLIHGDVFRFPPHRMPLSNIIGVGVQFLCLCAMIIVFGLVGLYIPYNRGTMKSTAVAMFAITSFISGFVSNYYYKQFGGERWTWNVVLTASLVPAPLGLVWCVLNSIAWYHHSTVALPVGTVIALVVIWLLVGCPLTLIGGILGRNRAPPFDAPCRVRNIPREIPDVPTHVTLPAQMFIAGALAFSAISMELYYIFSTVWGHKVYTLYGILLIVFGILVVVTSFITVALTYFQLSHENYQWWWRSVINAGSSSLFLFGYSIFFYHYRSEMSGVLQTWFYFGYMLLICYVFAIMMGAVGFLSSLTFVRYIYRNFKAD